MNENEIIGLENHIISFFSDGSGHSSQKGGYKRRFSKYGSPDCKSGQQVKLNYFLFKNGERMKIENLKQKIKDFREKLKISKRNLVEQFDYVKFHYKRNDDRKI